MRGLANKITNRASCLSSVNISAFKGRNIFKTKNEIVTNFKIRRQENSRGCETGWIAETLIPW